MARGTNPQRHRISEVYNWLLVAFALGGMAIIGRVLWIQYIQGDALRELGDRTVYKLESLEANRGNILAEDGRTLATSLPHFRLHMDMCAQGLTEQVFESGLDSMSIGLARIFGGKSAESYRADLLEKRRKRLRYTWLATDRLISYSQLKTLQQYPILRLPSNRGGIIVSRHFLRFRPLGDLAARTIGSCNAEGNVGLEDAFQHELSGEAGRRLVQITYGNKTIPVGSEDQVPPRDGLDVITTLDINLQDVVSRALRQQLELHKAHHGCVVVMEVKTGAIKAIANLTLRKNGQYGDDVNYAVGASTEPGSTFKLAALIALLEDGLVDLNDTVDTGDGRLRVGDRYIADTKVGGYGKITVQRAWEVSSNVGVAKLMLSGYKGRVDEFIKRLYSMRLDQPLGVEIRGEGRPFINSPNSGHWNGTSLAMMGIGYEVRMTPLQMLAFYNAVANDGKVVRPRFVNALADHGRIIKRYEPVVIESSLCSKRTLEKVKRVLAGVVENGTAKNLQGAVYTIAGKTGTAQIAKGTRGYGAGADVAYQASFAGFFPVDAPRYSCIVVVSSPTQNGYYGNMVAGPIFREIADKIYATRSEWFPRVDGESSGHVLATKAGSRDALQSYLAGQGIVVEDQSQQSDWVRTERRGSAVRLTPYGASSQGVPDVQGLPLNDAIYRLENAGLRVRVRGRGSVRTQSIAPGAHVRRGETVWLEMSII